MAASLFEMGNARHDRDSARLELAAARQSLLVTTERLNVTSDLKDVYKRSSANRGRTLRQMQHQMNSDRSHMIDCWTALVRIVPREKMVSIFGQPPGYLGQPQRHRGIFANFVRRCAAVVA
jgi:hypothetical protein